MPHHHTRPHPTRLATTAPATPSPPTTPAAPHPPAPAPAHPPHPATHPPHRPVHQPRQRPPTRPQRLREHRRRIQQLHRHPRPLRTLTRKHEHRAAHHRRPPHHTATRTSPRRQRPQAPPATPHDHAPTPPHDPPTPHDPASENPTSSNVQPRALRHELPQPPRLPPQPTHTPTRHHQRHHTTRPRASAADRRLDRARVLRTSAPSGAAASSRITCALVPLIPNEDTPARRGRSPAGHGRGSVSSSTSPADQSTCGDGCIHVQRARQHPVPHRQHHLDHPGHARRRLGVADVRLDRAQPQRAAPARSCP